VRIEEEEESGVRGRGDSIEEEERGSAGGGRGELKGEKAVESLESFRKNRRLRGMAL